MPENILSLYTRLATKRRKSLSEREVKCVIVQCLAGLAYLHDKNIIHRDIKPENILIDKRTREVRVTDFGLSKQLNSSEMTIYVSTRWYRAPELLLKSPDYSTPADIFALGCIMAELLRSKELFDGSDTLDQIHKILSVLGTPSQEEWPDFHLLTKHLDLPKHPRAHLGNIFPGLSEQGLGVLQAMLCYDPLKRATARELLRSPYF